MIGDAHGEAPDAILLSPATLTLRWGDRSVALAAAVLRARCRCAACRAAAIRGAPQAPPADPAFALVDATPVGHYALMLRFSDGHERGIYPWPYLREIADAQRPSDPGQA